MEHNLHVREIAVLGHIEVSVCQLGVGIARPSLPDRGLQRAQLVWQVGEMEVRRLCAMCQYAPAENSPHTVSHMRANSFLIPVWLFDVNSRSYDR